MLNTPNLPLTFIITAHFLENTQRQTSCCNKLWFYSFFRPHGKEAFKYKPREEYFFIPVWLRNRLLSAGLEPVLSLTEKSCVASNYRQFSTNIKIKIIKLKPSFVSPGLRPLAADKTGFNLKIFHFDIRGKLSIIRCDKYILLDFDRN